MPITFPLVSLRVVGKGKMKAPGRVEMNNNGLLRPSRGTHNFIVVPVGG